MSRRIAIGCALWAFGALGCARPTPSPAAADLGARIAGVWSARLTLDRPPIFVREKAAAARALSGDFAFLRAGSGRREGASGAAAFGVYDIDFTGLGVPQRRGVPSAALYAVSSDSLEIQLDRADAEGYVVLRGKLEGDSISGVWDISIPRVTEGGGKFLLVRRDR